MFETSIDSNTIGGVATLFFIGGMAAMAGIHVIQRVVTPIAEHLAVRLAVMFLVGIDNTKKRIADRAEARAKAAAEAKAKRDADLEAQQRREAEAKEFEEFKKAKANGAAPAEATPAAPADERDQRPAA